MCFCFSLLELPAIKSTRVDELGKFQQGAFSLRQYTIEATLSMLQIDSSASLYHFYRGLWVGTSDEVLTQQQQL